VRPTRFWGCRRAITVWYEAAGRWWHVDDHVLPVVGRKALYEVCCALDRGEHVVAALDLAAAGDGLAECGVTEDVTKGVARLDDELEPMSQEEEARADATHARDPCVVERSDHGLAGAGRGDDEAAMVT